MMEEKQPGTDDIFMHRCIELAMHGAGNVATNPMVGAVLVHDGKIIGEGYHQKYGEPHAEPNCINSVTAENRNLIPLSTLYVSLEPCAHHGKTPPCADLVIRNGIRKVVIGTRDPFQQVNGKGIEKLRQAGVEVIVGVLEDECKKLNKRFFTFHVQRRPYIILKWAQTADEKISSGTAERLLISNEFTNRLVHKWRSEEAAILVGTNTALLDDPMLNVRSWTANDPVRLVIDMNLRLPAHLKIFDGSQPTIVFNTLKHLEEGKVRFYQVKAGASLVQQVLKACYHLGIQSILVEGGATLLQAFIDEQSWDEARVVTNSGITAANGVAAPVLRDHTLLKNDNIASDTISTFQRNEKPVA
jgi:diaminohydroxyphosphoribosylaminopyrimidine deaminase / 5-amino-6-(5-phosphoribosylamino)uracil reductase